jgi:O-antigen ligase
LSLTHPGIEAPFKAGSTPIGRAFMRTQTQKLLDLMVAFWIFTGSLVMFEPSPYEFAFILVLPVAFLAGMGIYRSTLGLLAIVLAFIPFALIGAFQVRTQPVTDGLQFVAITIFLLVTAYFAANFVAGDTQRRMRLVINAYTIAAVICAIIGTLAYLGLMPSADTFLRYGRAKSTFNDPNVFGPFLILPAMFALQRVLLGRGRQVIFAGAVFMILFVGVFVSFSRAAWGHFAFSSLIVLALCFWLEAWAHDKVRIIIMSIVGAGMLAVALGGLLSIPSVNALFETRAAGQDYDSGETGRFGRQGFAFELALSNPWGIGPGEFHTMRVTEEPHDVYVQVLHAYGWGGGAMYYLLVILTLWRGIASLRRRSPYRLMMIPPIATYAMVVGESAIIDSDHWRHYYLLVGLIWGVASAIGKDQRGAISRDAMLI